MLESSRCSSDRHSIMHRHFITRQSQETTACHKFSGRCVMLRRTAWLHSCQQVDRRFTVFSKRKKKFVAVIFIQPIKCEQQWPRRCLMEETFPTYLNLLRQFWCFWVSNWLMYQKNVAELSLMWVCFLKTSLLRGSKYIKLYGC